MNSNITHSADECNVIPTATTKNNTTFATSILDEHIPGSSGEEKKGKMHGFSKKVSLTTNKKGEVLGDNAALILRYLAAITRTHGRKVDGKTWVRVNLDHISKQYPYLGRSTVDENLLRLQRFGCCEMKQADGALKSRKNDRTRCYHVPKKWMDAAEEEPRYFSCAVACEVKVPAAVVFYNFCHWVGECKEKKLVEHVKLAPAILVELLPYDKATIKRAIKKLVANEYIHPLVGEQCWYAAGSDKSGGAKADKGGAKADEPGSKADESGAKADNYIYCNRLTDVLEIDSKEKPAVSSLELSSDETNKTNNLITSSDDDITTCADGQDRKEMTHGMMTASFSDLSHSQDESISTSLNSTSLQNSSLFTGQNSNADFVCTEGSVIPSTVNINGEAEDGNGKWPHIADYEQLRNKNKSLADEVNAIEDMPNVKTKLLDTIYVISIKVLSEVDQSILDELYDNADAEEITKVLLPYHQQFFDQSILDPSHAFFDIYYYGAFEAIVGGIVWTENPHDGYSHPIVCFNGVTRKVHYGFARREEELRVKAVEEEFVQRREEFASVDAHKENDDDLSPAERTRVFRNALNSRNKVGWICYDQQHRTDQITGINTRALNLVQRLFAFNPELTPKELLSIMNGCMEAYLKQPAPAKLERYREHYPTESQKWHARMGHNLMFFVSNLHHIVRQLGMTTGCPVKMFLQNIKAQQENECELAMAA